MSNWIPKEKLTAYQRWEVAAFDEEERAAEAPPAAEPPVEKAADEDSEQLADTRADQAPRDDGDDQTAAPPVVLPTAEDIERMHHEAHEAGYAAGYQEGVAAAQASATAMATLMDNLQQAMTGIDQDVADQLLALAIEVASQVLRQSLQIRPELLLPVVREAVTTLHPHHGQPLLFVHPGDAALVRSHLGDQLTHVNWRLVEDTTLTPGGCRVELAGSEVDATLETRWRRVVEGIGISEKWLETGDSESKPNPR